MFIFIKFVYESNIKYFIHLFVKYRKWTRKQHATMARIVPKIWQQRRGGRWGRTYAAGIREFEGNESDACSTGRVRAARACVLAGLHGADVCGFRISNIDFL